jgi:hypothetical protein
MSTENQEQSSETPVITAYNVKKKQKGCVMFNAVISKTAKGAYMAQGLSEDGDKLTTLMGKEKAEAAVAAGIATWAEEKTDG